MHFIQSTSDFTETIQYAIAADVENLKLAAVGLNHVLAGRDYFAKRFTQNIYPAVMVRSNLII
jgi:hypothetical protein